MINNLEDALIEALSPDNKTQQLELTIKIMIDVNKISDYSDDFENSISCIEQYAFVEIMSPKLIST